MPVIYFTFKYFLDDPRKYKEITKGYCRIIKNLYGNITKYPVTTGSIRVGYHIKVFKCWVYTTHLPVMLPI